MFFRVWTIWYLVKLRDKWICSKEGFMKKGLEQILLHIKAFLTHYGKKKYRKFCPFCKQVVSSLLIFEHFLNFQCHWRWSRIYKQCLWRSEKVKNLDKSVNVGIVPFYFYLRKKLFFTKFAESVMFQKVILYVFFLSSIFSASIQYRRSWKNLWQIILFNNY